MRTRRAYRGFVGWCCLCLLGGCVAGGCSDDDSNPTSDSGGEAGGSDTPSGGSSADSAGTAGSSLATAGSTSGSQDGGSSTSESTGGASGGRDASDPSPGGAEAGAGEGGAPALPAGPYIPCPAIGEKFQLFGGSEYSDANVALSKAFDCPLDDTAGRTFTVERFQLAETRLEVLSTLFLIDNYDWFGVTLDCGPTGYVTPIARADRADFPNVFAKVLAPGTYTRISCEVDMLEEQVPVPTLALNVDCAHAVTLKPGTLETAYAETRVWNQPALFYKISLGDSQPEPAWQVDVNATAAETSAGLKVNLHGISSVLDEESEIDGLNGGHPAHFYPVPGGDYCLEVNAANGVQYSIFYSAFGSY